MLEWNLAKIFLSVMVYMSLNECLYAAYTPKYVERWSSSVLWQGVNPSVISVPTSTLKSENLTFFCGISGFYYRSPNKLEMQLVSFFSDSTVISKMYKGDSSTLHSYDITLIASNDGKKLLTWWFIDGIAAVNNFSLSNHANWTIFSTAVGHRRIEYNVSYSPRDPTLFSNNMTAELIFTYVNCSNYVDDFNFFLNVLNISTYWIVFELKANGSTVFNNLAVDILISSQAFRGTLLFGCIIFRVSWDDPD